MQQTCKICNKLFYNLKSHLRLHKITWKEYLEQYNEVPIGIYIKKEPESEKIYRDYVMKTTERVRRKKC